MIASYNINVAHTNYMIILFLCTDSSTKGVTVALMLPWVIVLATVAAVP